jgi:antitoxin MazE
MNLTIQKWGNSLALRIPKTVAKQVNVHQGSRMDMSLVANKIILTSSEVKEYDLKSLLKKVNKKNLHQEVSFGKAVGKEVW